MLAVDLLSSLKPTLIALGGSGGVGGIGWSYWGKDILCSDMVVVIS